MHKVAEAALEGQSTHRWHAASVDVGVHDDKTDTLKMMNRVKSLMQDVVKDLQDSS